MLIEPFFKSQKTKGCGSPGGKIMSDNSGGPIVIILALKLRGGPLPCKSESPESGKSPQLTASREWRQSS